MNGTLSPARGRAVAMAVVLAAVFMANIDLWIVNVALVTIQRHRSPRSRVSS